MCKSLTERQNVKGANTSLYHYKPLTLEIRKGLKLKVSERFRYYYKSSKNLLNDFVVYLTKVCFKPKKTAQALSSSIRSVWMALDKEMLIRPNAIGSPDKLKDLYFHPMPKKIRV